MLFSVFCFVGVFIGAVYSIDLSGCAPGPAKVIQLPFNAKGEVKSPGYENNEYPNSIQCTYTIISPFGTKIKLSFKDFDIDPFDMCMKDRLLVHDGIDNRGPVHGVLCGSDIPNDIVSLGNAITLVFMSDFLTGRKGFRIEYSVGLLQSLCPLGQMPCRNRNCYLFKDRCNGVDDCGDGSDEENCNHPLPGSVCGITPIEPFSSEGLDRVVGGREAKPGSWPWQADLQLAMFQPNGHMCGGTLINAEWVVSAAHCFQSNGRASEWRVHFGNHHKFKTDKTEQVRYAQRIIVYPGYTGDQELRYGRVDLTNDIALIKLSSPVQFTDSVRPACLPARNQEIAAGTDCMASGWGMTRGTGSNDVLKQVKLTIQPSDKCLNDMMPHIPKTMICVKNPEGFNDVCHGDSGGPLVCKISNSWYIMGATSHGTATNFLGGLCALPEARTVYAKVSDKIQWITDMIQRYN